MDTVDGDLGANPTIVPISVEKQVKQSSKPSLLRRFRELRRGSSLSTQESDERPTDSPGGNDDVTSAVPTAKPQHTVQSAGAGSIFMRLRRSSTKSQPPRVTPPTPQDDDEHTTTTPSGCTDENTTAMIASGGEDYVRDDGCEMLTVDAAEICNTHDGCADDSVARKDVASVSVQHSINPPTHGAGRDPSDEAAIVSAVDTDAGDTQNRDGADVDLGLPATGRGANPNSDTGVTVADHDIASEVACRNGDKIEDASVDDNTSLSALAADHTLPVDGSTHTADVTEVDCVHNQAGCDSTMSDVENADRENTNAENADTDTANTENVDTDAANTEKNADTDNVNAENADAGSMVDDGADGVPEPATLGTKIRGFYSRIRRKSNFGHRRTNSAPISMFGLRRFNTKDATKESTTSDPNNAINDPTGVTQDYVADGTTATVQDGIIHGISSVGEAGAGEADGGAMDVVGEEHSDGGSSASECARLQKSSTAVHVGEDTDAGSNQLTGGATDKLSSSSASDDDGVTHTAGKTRGTAEHARSGSITPTPRTRKYTHRRSASHASIVTTSSGHNLTPEKGGEWLTGERGVLRLHLASKTTASAADAVRFLEELLALESLLPRRTLLETYLQGFQDATHPGDTIWDDKSENTDTLHERPAILSATEIMQSITEKHTHKDEKGGKLKRILHRRSKSDVLDQLLLVEHMGDDSDLAGMLTDHEACDDVIRGSLEFDSFGLTPPARPPPPVAFTPTPIGARMLVEEGDPDVRRAAPIERSASLPFGNFYEFRAASTSFDLLEDSFGDGLLQDGEFFRDEDADADGNACDAVPRSQSDTVLPSSTDDTSHCTEEATPSEVNTVTTKTQDTCRPLGGTDGDPDSVYSTPCDEHALLNTSLVALPNCELEQGSVHVQADTGLEHKSEDVQADTGLEHESMDVQPNRVGLEHVSVHVQPDTGLEYESVDVQPDSMCIVDDGVGFRDPSIPVSESCQTPSETPSERCTSPSNPRDSSEPPAPVSYNDMSLRNERAASDGLHDVTRTDPQDHNQDKTII